MTMLPLWQRPEGSVRNAHVFLPVLIVTSCPEAAVFPCRVPALVVVVLR